MAKMIKKYGTTPWVYHTDKLIDYHKKIFEEVFHTCPIARLFRLKDLDPLDQEG